ncbi:hypothetical protein G6011_06420 [Alternaria panax]|uniref:Uncharacterized protein n=1 Tax=Alternaria panax TaxID=48097 RepID=A0AAD4I836_9PLEO|nr:hypothetical protein G6011_06420 [Alternaria panax]
MPTLSPPTALTFLFLPQLPDRFTHDHRRITAFFSSTSFTFSAIPFGYPNFFTRVKLVRSKPPRSWFMELFIFVDETVARRRRRKWRSVWPTDGELDA